MTPNGIWRQFLRSAGIIRRFPPPRIVSELQARSVLEVLDTFLARNANRFDTLFLDGKPLALKDAERPLMEVLASAGYVNTALAAVVRPCVRLFLLDELIVATDLNTHDDEDQVFFLTLEQIFLVRSIDVHKGDHVLELCLGSGVNAIAAGRRGAARIVGVDVSERALAFAAANAALNLSRERGEPPLETLHGSLFAPLTAGDRFDLILVNPPFELVPPNTQYFLHSHGGEDGLDVVRAFLPGVPEQLSPGGRFEMFTWSPGDEESERVTDLVLAAFPGFRVEARRVDGLPLEMRLDKFRDRPGYAEWRDRLASQGWTHVWGVHIRALRDGPGGLARIDATDEVRVCKQTLFEWE